MTKSAVKKSIAIIGAGASGIAATKLVLIYTKQFLLIKF